MGAALRSEVLGTSGLAVLAVIALCTSRWRRPSVTTTHGTARLFAIGVTLQTAHAFEEVLTGFAARFPESIGLAPWPTSFFLAFNGFWLGVWVWTEVRLARGVTPGFAAWFFAFAALANGIAHPLLAWRAHSYFPGLVTAPFLGLVGFLLIRRFCMTTRPTPSSVSLRGFLLFMEVLTFTVFVPGTVTYWLPRALDLWGPVPARPWPPAAWLSVAPLALGLAIYVRCAWEFATRGRGIPAPIDHPKQLVVSGLYRYVRNPMYLGVLLVLIGESLLFRSPSFLIYTLVWLALVHAFIVIYEEPNLHRKFDGSYDAYRTHVRRWIPGRAYRT
jgi:protein-S-isoprenylcysteine O-methyltransferase Ste14